MPSVLITGANRGIGLGFVKEMLKEPSIDVVIATARNVEAAKVYSFFPFPWFHPFGSIHRLVYHLCERKISSTRFNSGPRCNCEPQTAHRPNGSHR